jgi:hypothetical protein
MKSVRKPRRKNGRNISLPKVQKSDDIILIICEGQKTEPRYFKSLLKELRIPSSRVELLDKKSGMTPLTLVKTVFDKKKDYEKLTEVSVDEVWCVFDHEGCHKDPRFEDAVRYANDHDLQLAVSYPCFEYWILLHFKKTTKAFANCRDVIKVLKSYIPSYNKAEIDFENLYPRIKKAVVHAVEVRKYNEDINKMCPATYVDLLVRRINSLARDPLDL